MDDRSRRAMRSAPRGRFRVVRAGGQTINCRDPQWSTRPITGLIAVASANGWGAQQPSGPVEKADGDAQHWPKNLPEDVPRQH